MCLMGSIYQNNWIEKKKSDNCLFTSLFICHLADIGTFLSGRLWPSPFSWSSWNFQDILILSVRAKVKVTGVNFALKILIFCTFSLTRPGDFTRSSSKLGKMCSINILKPYWNVNLYFWLNQFLGVGGVTNVKNMAFQRTCL